MKLFCHFQPTKLQIFHGFFYKVQKKPLELLKKIVLLEFDF